MTHSIKDFWPNGRIMFEYLRENEVIKNLRCWEVSGEPIADQYIKYEEDDTDDALVFRLKYICKKMPVPSFSRTKTSKSRAVIMSKSGPYYLGSDF